MSRPILTEILSCPVDDCDWTHMEKPPVVPEATLAAIFGPGVMTVVARTQYQQRLERVLEQHFATHTTEDYLRTITRLKDELRREAAS